MVKIVIKNSICNWIFSRASNLFYINKCAKEKNYPHIANILEAMQFIPGTEDIKGEINHTKQLLIRNDKFSLESNKINPKKDCYIIIPKANTDLFILCKYIINESSFEEQQKKMIIVNLLKQAIISLYLFHKCINKLHCDPHSKNFFIFSSSCKINEYCFQNSYKTKSNLSYNIDKFNLKGIEVVLFDFGTVIEPDITNNSSCIKYAFDYYKLFSLNSKSVGRVVNKKYKWDFIENCWNITYKGLGLNKDLTFSKEYSVIHSTLKGENPDDLIILIFLMKYVKTY